MKIVDLDYYALTGNSLLHKAKTELKLLWVAGLIFLIIFANDFKILAGIYSVILAYIVFSKLKTRQILMLTYYPLLFVIVLVFSTTSFAPGFVILVTLKVLIAASAMVLLFATTSFVRLFSVLGKIMPGFLVTTLFLSYRAIFILWTTVENIQQALYLRGGISRKTPRRSLKVLANSLGFLIIRSLESSEKMYEGLYLRGHSNKLKYLDVKNG